MSARAASADLARLKAAPPISGMPGFLGFD
jgi:hypothetical protein